jgi:rhamnosyltransferase
MKSINRCNTRCVIVTYNPDNNVLNLVRKLTSLGLYVCVVDNNSSNFIELNNKLRAITNDGVYVIHNNKNLGIAAALNQGIRYVKAKEVDWIFTFDQDSLPSDSFIDCYNSVIEKEENVGLVCPGYTCNKDELIEKKNSVKYGIKLNLITSGMLHNTVIFDTIGLYNEELFIDYVDFEYVLRVSQKYKTIKIYDKILYHVIGAPLKCKILGKTFVSSNHSPIRRYYKSRNIIYLYENWHKVYPAWINRLVLGYFKSLIIMLIIERQRCSKIVMCFKGLYDGICKKC